jgi:hypothetical protein
VGEAAGAGGAEWREVDDQAPGAAAGSVLSITVTVLVIMPIQQLNRKRPAFSGVNRMTFAPGSKLCSMPKAGRIIRLLQPLIEPLGALIVHSTGTPAVTVMGS